VHPRIIRGLLRRLRRLPAEFSLAYSDTLKMLCMYVACWCIYGVGFYLIGTSLRLGTPSPALGSGGAGVVAPMIGINAISWAGGLVSIITPAGLGVREGISQVLLAGIVAKPYPALIPLAARVWITLAEVGTIGLLLLWKGSK
jgi:hypothetical protein